MKNYTKPTLDVIFLGGGNTLLTASAENSTFVDMNDLFNAGSTGNGGIGND